ncbi:ParB/RepB/Spo0J family partition protein [Variovorax paradoxus]|uniref:ParB/RepB/Spo0J family partition protein n=1 Tax=Variovorax paradoxus TaxID=34073 RepID=UPI001D179A1E|nr:ParB/RepB/Spo0J family partition protein [Variovorax paradoxus]
MTTQIQIQYLPPGALQANPWNTNKLDPAAEGKLENSILEFEDLGGLYKPIICRELPDGSLQILGGEHRTRAAERLGIAKVPVINLGPVSDLRAKALGLADNGQYGQDDAAGLATLLEELRLDENLLAILPYSDSDLAGIFASVAIDLDAIGMGESDEPDHGLPDPDTLPPRPTITHELMRFKVPVEDRDRVEKLIQSVIKDKGLKTEQDSLIAAGMALVEICNAAKGQL